MSKLFGSVFQNGYVVHDLPAALQHWTGVAGVGPFFVLDDVAIPGFVYRGAPSGAVVSVALAFSGDLQIELIQTRNDAPSLYRDFLAAGREGLQHLGYFTADYDGALARAAAAGIAVAQAGNGASGGTRFAYLDTEAHPGTVIELIEASESSRAFHGMIREAARGWDGSDPVRKIPLPR